MKQTNNGGPAFPGLRYVEPGMSLRDWFAGQALAGLLSYEGPWSETSRLAAYAYEHADAMLAERAKAEGEE